MTIDDKIKISEWLNLGYQPARDTYLSTEKDAAKTLTNAKRIIAISSLEVRTLKLEERVDFASQRINRMPADKEVRITLLNS